MGLLLVGTWLAVNGLLFAVYRLLFLARCADAVSFPDLVRVLLYGLRLDLALLGFELSFVGLFTLLLRRLRLHGTLRWLWGLMALHVFLCLSNFFSFAERTQNAGDLILPYITSPYQVYLAVLPFVQQHWLLMTGMVAGVAIYFWFGVRLGRRLKAGAAPLDLWGSWKTLAVSLVLLVALPLMFTWQPIVKKKNTTRNRGITPVFANSKFYTQFSDFRLNEAVINPLYEFVGVQFPAAMHQTVSYHLTEAGALAEWRKPGDPPLDARYPLLRDIRGREGSGLENVVIIQVEGLSGSLLEQERNGRPVMPFLRKLTRDGIYFPNAFQNANFTSGGVFSTAVSLPKAAWEEPTRRFASHELHGYYGSLAHILGATNYTHYFFEAFRQSGDDFLAFMSYQGCKVLNYQAFRDRLTSKNQLADGDSILGIHDGYLMQECAEILSRCPTRFTAHLMTSTTHSPWTTPPSFGSPFPEPDMNTFAYLDASIETFVRRLEQVPGVGEKTLFIILGDHTSVTFGKNLLERLRIPLIFYGPGLPKLEQADTIWASQVDVVPTVLGLMPGDHLYGGLGRNLLDPSERTAGIVSGTRDTGFYLTKNWVLQYHPFGGEPQLFAATNGGVAPVNLAGENPKEVDHLLQEYFARVELARRLSRDKRVFPFTPDKG